MTNPEQDCDLVMRGGIASGVVYPTAVHEIAKKYRLRSIGGTSAGAIAAVAAAAAEYARQKAAKKSPSEGADTDAFAPFERLRGVPEELGEPVGFRKARLFSLFQAQKTTAPVYRILQTFLRHPETESSSQMLLFVWALVRNFPLAAILGALLPLAAAIALVERSSALKELVSGSVLGIGAQDVTPFNAFGFLGISNSGLLSALIATVVVAGIFALLLLLLALTHNIVMVAAYVGIPLVGAVAFVIASGAKWFNAELFQNLTLLLLTLAMIAGAWACSVLAAFVAANARAREAIPKNLYGLCSGLGRQTATGRIEGLTEWLHKKVQEIANEPLDEPLTVGDLRRGCKRGELGQGDIEPSDPLVKLALITTNTTRSMPHRFPELEGETDNPDGNEPGWRGALYFRREDMEQLFPESVVNCLIGDRPHKPTDDKAMKDGIPRSVMVPRTSKSGALPDLEETIVDDSSGRPMAPQVFYRLPHPDDLPVLLGARMSMAFPILLSAVPLYARGEYSSPSNETLQAYPKLKGPEYENETVLTMRKCWFADGAVTSNFPIHLFDSPIPSRPTFGISFVGNDVNGWEEQEFTYMPEDPSRIMFMKLQRFNMFETGHFDVGGFLSSLLWTSMNWTDNENMNLPGNRDRIVHVRFKANEGGHNLNMDMRTIKTLSERGAEAGRKLAERFDFGNEHGKWNDHRWIRYRVFMAALQDMIDKFAARWGETDDEMPEGIQSLQQMLHVSNPAELPDPAAYEFDDGQFKDALNATLHFADTHEKLGKSQLAKAAPKPRPRLTMGPPSA